MRIERKKVLRTFDEIQSDKRNATEQEHGEAILFPIHFLRFINATEAIDETFDGAAEEIKKRFFLGENACEKDANWLRKQKNDEEKQEDLKDADG